MYTIHAPTRSNAYIHARVCVLHASYMCYNDVEPDTFAAYNSKAVISRQSEHTDYYHLESLRAYN